ncbi:MAG: hypothetical protein ABW000_23060 [Actinoplanes sp.]
MIQFSRAVSEKTYRGSVSSSRAGRTRSVWYGERSAAPAAA